MANKLLKQGYDRGTVDLVLDAWRKSTKKTYSTYLRKWITFCLSKGLKVLHPTIQIVCTFLRQLADGGLGYGAMNTARSALATILPRYDGYEMGKHPIICLMIKGVYERNPPKAKYSAFWDVNKVFYLLKDGGRTRT